MVNNMDKKGSCATLLTRLSRAFDCIVHKKAKSKLT